MKKNDTHAFVNQLLVCVLVTICFGGSIGLGTVWLRHRISVTAKTNRDLELRIAVLDRQLNETTSLIDQEGSIEPLRERNRDWRLGLVLMDEKQVQSVSEDPVLRMARRANEQLFRQDGPARRRAMAAIGQ